MRFKRDSFNVKRIESINLNLLLGCANEEVTSLIDGVVVFDNNVITVFKLRGIKFFWSIKYYYLYFNNGKVTDAFCSRFKNNDYFFY